MRYYLLPDLAPAALIASKFRPWRRQLRGGCPLPRRPTRGRCRWRPTLNGVQGGGAPPGDHRSLSIPHSPLRRIASAALAPPPQPLHDRRGGRICSQELRLPPFHGSEFTLRPGRGALNARWSVSSSSKDGGQGARFQGEEVERVPGSAPERARPP